MAISSDCQLRVSLAALSEYVVEGAGVLNEGSGGSVSKSLLGIGQLLAQAVTLTASAISSSLQSGLLLDGVIQGSLVCVVDRAFDGQHAPTGGRALISDLLAVLACLQALVGQLSPQARSLEGPSQCSASSSGCQ
ncbi:hypothetical protein N5D77_22570 [Comamonas thiooxydans]|uniref:Uncharacterized protein n=1 Tax=Comamonas thiooxydans TaxID=363952 RepID=A0AA42TUN7_9BURK|nr:hypothetical protein [Comamonas thiooxydans]MDH1336856.1 hypothetical protein [Comamonas thiooxydans]MDH1743779.1 hypothetical protein [Comamonas thiooxydans]MDH1789365.1 hypothetical protein [Comamonas thiooxydans]